MKIADTKFTIQFSRTDPTHLQVAEILNRQGRRSKAQYLVNAILHYENCGETPNIQLPEGFDEKIIESVVIRVLREIEESKANKQVSDISSKTPKSAEDINIDDVMDSLGQNGLNAITGVLDMFRKK